MDRTLAWSVAFRAFVEDGSASLVHVCRNDLRCWLAEESQDGRIGEARAAACAVAALVENLSNRARAAVLKEELTEEEANRGFVGIRGE